MLMHSFACIYNFLIAILKGEPRRFEPRPYLKASNTNPVESFFLSAKVQVILNGVVATVLITCTGSPSSNP
jgi:hypothetical protein